MRTVAPLILFLTCSIALGGTQDRAPGQVAKSFYEALKKPRRTPALEQELKSISPFLSGDLNTLIAEANRASDAYLRRFPTDVPPFEHGLCVFFGGGDCEFSSFHLVTVVIDGSSAKVTVGLSLIDVNRPKEPPHRWENVVLMKSERGWWVIADIENPDGTAAGTLRQITKDAGAGK